MSPYPPARLVSRGVYRVVADPMYVGAVLLCGGLSVIAASPAGVWIVTPVLALSAAAFVLGYERDATRARFGAVSSAWLRLRAPSALSPLWAWGCRGAEAVANSWREWRVGPVRMMSHGFYAAAGSTAGRGAGGLDGGPRLAVVDRAGDASVPRSGRRCGRSSSKGRRSCFARTATSGRSSRRRSCARSWGRSAWTAGGCCRRWRSARASPRCSGGSGASSRAAATGVPSIGRGESAIATSGRGS